MAGVQSPCEILRKQSVVRRCPSAAAGRGGEGFCSHMSAFGWRAVEGNGKCLKKI